MSRKMEMLEKINFVAIVVFIIATVILTITVNPLALIFITMPIFAVFGLVEVAVVMIMELNKGNQES